MNEKQRFGEILVRAGVLDRAALSKVLAEIEDRRIDLGEALVSKGLLDEPTMLQAVGKALNLPSVSLDGARPDERALALVPRALCAEFGLIPIEVERSRTGEHLHVAMANPTDVQAIKAVTREARRRIRPLLAPARAIRIAIERFYGPEAGAAAARRASDDLFDDLSPAPEPVREPHREPPARDLLREPPREPPAARAASRDSVPDLSGATLAQPARRPSAIELDEPRSLIPPDVDPRPAPRSTQALRRGLDADLLDALDHSAMESVAGPGDLALSSRGGDYGLVRRGVRRPRSRTDGASPSQSTPALGPGPLPALPPGLGGRRRRPERTTNRPEPRRRPGTSPPPANMPTSRHAGEVFDAELDLPTPDGVIDDRESPERVDVRRLLERMVSETAEDESGADHVVSEYLDRYGTGTAGTGDRLFAALDRALGDAPTGTSKLLVVLIRHLARRGLVDLDELVAALSE